MPVQPIDLQVLMSRIPEVGKIQAVEKEAAQIAQMVQAGELVLKTEVQTHSVNESKETDSVQRIKDQEERRRKSGSKQTRQKGKAPKAPAEQFRDLDVGKKIDISG